MKKMNEQVGVEIWTGLSGVAVWGSTSGEETNSRPEEKYR